MRCEEEMRMGCPKLNLTHRPRRLVDEKYLAKHIFDQPKKCIVFSYHI